MCHKLLYAKIGVLDLFSWNMKKNTSWINKKINYIFEIYNIIPLTACPYFSLTLTGRFPKQLIAEASKTFSKNDVLR